MPSSFNLVTVDLEAKIPRRKKFVFKEMPLPTVWVHPITNLRPIFFQCKPNGGELYLVVGRIALYSHEEHIWVGLTCPCVLFYFNKHGILKKCRQVDIPLRILKPHNKYNWTITSQTVQDFMRGFLEPILVEMGFLIGGYTVR